MEPLHTFGEIVEHLEKSASNPTAFNYFENGHWKNYSTEAFVFNLKRLTYGLISLGMSRGDTVGILADSSPNWNLADFAIIIAGGITVPLFAKISHENFIYECAQANIKYLFIQGEEQWKMYDEHRNLFEKVIRFDEPEDYDAALSMHEILRIGEELWEKQPNLWDELLNQLNPDDICTIIYTAGSTGMPKGVQLSNLNLCHLVSFETFKWSAHDKYLSILPLAHIFARQINLILIAWGISIYYLNDLSLMGIVCKEIRPSLMIVVPRILERLFSAMEAKIRDDKHSLQGKLANWALDLALNPSTSVFNEHILRPIADRLVYKQMRNSLGGKWRVILSGGAALNKRLNQFFFNIGIPVYEGWGLTEASCIVVNNPDNYKIGTVGRPLPGVKLRLGAEDELLLGGPTIMKGYYRHPAATKAVIDKDGWLHTGDKGSIDPEGYVKITGRVKEQFKLSSGEYLAPGRIEYMLRQNPLIDMAMVIGEKKKYASCLLFPDFSFIKRQKKAQNMEGISDEEFLNSSSVQDEMQKLLDKINDRINSWEKLVQYRFILNPLSVEGGELTPALTLRRDAILLKYQDVVADIYGQEGK